MRVMISQPTRGQTLEERLAERQKIVSILEKQGHEVWGELSGKEPIPPGVNQLLWRLGRRLQDMAGTDAVYFMDGWEKDKRCRMEYQAAVAYEISTINAEWRELKNAFTVGQTLYECFPEEISYDKNESVAAVTNRIIRLCRELTFCNKARSRKRKRLRAIRGTQ